MALETCNQPLKLDLSQEPIRRLYATTFDISLGFMNGTRYRSQLDMQREYLTRIFNQNIGHYIMEQAFMDARQLTLLPTAAD